MLKNKWVTFIVIIFFIYSYAKERFSSSNLKTAPIVNPGDFPEIAKPNNISPTNVKDNNLSTKSPSASPNNPSPVAKLKLEEDAGILQQKIVGFVNQIISGPIGQKITEGIITSAPGDPNDPNFKHTPYHNLTKVDLIVGEGEQVKCGQKVKTHLVIKLGDGSVFLNTHLNKKPITFTVGQEEVIRGLEYNVISMAKEGYRKVILPPSQAYNNPKFVTSKIAEGEFINLEIELLDFSPLIDKKIENIITKTSTLNHFQDVYRCGDKAKFLYKIKDDKNGIVFYSSNDKNPSSGKIGNKNFPYILTWALDSMPLQSKKTIVFPSELLKNIDGEVTGFFPLIKTLPSTLILEIETLKLK